MKRFGKEGLKCWLIYVNARNLAAVDFRRPHLRQQLKMLVLNICTFVRWVIQKKEEMRLAQETWISFERYFQKY